MKISKKGLELIKKYEGCRLTAYRCPAGVWTIGYGHTAGVTPGMKITQAQAEQMLIEDMAKYEKKVDKYQSKYNFNQAQFDSLVSFAYNVGSIDGLTKNGTRTIAQISAKIPAYNKGGGKVLPGLVKRRAEEKALFDTKTIENYAENPTPNTAGVQVMNKKENVKNAIKNLQQALNDYGKYGLVVDGIFGPKTQDALNRYKRG